MTSFKKQISQILFMALVTGVVLASAGESPEFARHLARSFYIKQFSGIGSSDLEVLQAYFDERYIELCEEIKGINQQRSAVGMLLAEPARLISQNFDERYIELCEEIKRISQQRSAIRELLAEHARLISQKDDQNYLFLVSPLASDKNMSPLRLNNKRTERAESETVEQIKYPRY